MTGCKGTSDQPSTTNPSSGQTATSTKSNFNPTGFPIVNEKVTFRILTTYTPGNPPDFNDLEVMKKIEEKTNIHIEWILVPVDGYTEKRNLMLASGDLPDALGVTVPADELMRYGQQGVFIPMQDLVEKYAPNITALYDEIPNFKK
jgi:putative aldouronate transport system substrate-binding protein